MTSPDSNANASSSKYHVQIGEGKGIVIGDHAQLVQQFYDASAEPQVDLTAAEVSYRKKVEEAYKWLNFSGFDSPDLSLDIVPLEEVFVRLSLTVEKVIREPVQQDEANQGERRERVITMQEPIELSQALDTHLLVVGEPGAGKSTLLRWLAVTFAQRQQREPSRLGPSADTDRLPVLVELGHLPGRYVKPEGREIPNWIQLLPEYLNAQMAFTNTPPQLLTQALAEGRCLLLFDGLDEVADRQARARLARSLAELVRLFPGNRVIVGSRPAGVSESEGTLRPQFQRCQIERFTPEDVQRFFRFWYGLDRGLTQEQQREAADALYARVQDTPTTLRLASTPLLSTILVLIWRNEGDLPARRVELYERCCRVLIERWEASHDVAYQGTLVGMDWEDHLRLLTPLAYTIHSQEQRTSATREELVPLLAQALQTAGYSNEQAAATREAKQFLDALGLRSGLLQYLGNDRYGFPHQTFQEYLAARYIAAQPDPDYIDLVMAHLHEAWWREVHLLTIAHLGSGNVGASNASALVLTILHVYAQPSWILRASSRNRWLRLIGLEKLLSQMQIERRIAWILAREFEMAAEAYAECVPEGMAAGVGAVLSAQAASLVRHIIYDWDRHEEQHALLTVTRQFLPRQENEEEVNALLWVALHNANSGVRRGAAASLAKIGVGNEAVVNALLQAVLHNIASYVRQSAAEILGQMGVGNETVVSALLQVVRHDTDSNVRGHAAASLGQMGVGNEAVVSTMLQVLLSRGADKDVRQRAAASLGQVGAGNEAVVSALLQAGLHDTDWGVQNRAAASLAKIGAGNEAVVNALLQVVRHDTASYMRERVAKSLGQMGTGNEAVVNALLQAGLHDTDWGVRQRAAEILGQVGAGNEAVVNALLQVVRHDTASYMRERAAKSLGQVGAGNEAVVSVLLEALHDTDSDVQQRAAVSLGQLEITEMTRLRRVLVALNRCLYDRGFYERRAALASIRQLLDGRPIPGYQWVPFRKRRAQKRLLKRIAFWLVTAAIMIIIGLAATLLLGALDPNDFLVRFLTVLAAIAAFVAAVAQVLGRTLRDPWEHS